MRRTYISQVFVFVSLTLYSMGDHMAAALFLFGLQRYKRIPGKDYIFKLKKCNYMGLEGWPIPEDLGSNCSHGVL